MNKPMKFYRAFIITLLAGLIFSSCSRVKEGTIIFTIIEGDMRPGLNGSQCRLVMIDPGKPGKIKIISEGFYSACSATISPDGKKLAFSGKLNQDDPWQIWMIYRGNRRAVRVTNTEFDCTDACWLPGRRISFAGNNGSLYTCNEDGSNLTRITFDTYSYRLLNILNDGRLVASRSSGDEVSVIRPDGTKAGLFFQGVDYSFVNSRLYECEDGTIYFSQVRNTEYEKADIVRISYQRPMHSLVNLTAGVGGSFVYPFPVSPGRLIVSWRQKPNEKYSLREFDAEKKEFTGTVFEDPYFNAIEAVVVKKCNTPKNLPSEVDKGVKTGLLLCQDINHNSISAEGEFTLTRTADRIEVMGVDSSMGTVKVESDGSFYLKVIADTPFRILTYDNTGNRIDGPCDWIYLRPNERRGCAGCHEDQETVPANRQPFAVRKQPVSIPVEIKKLREKEIELE